jgi:hypothetical protein
MEWSARVLMMPDSLPAMNVHAIAQILTFNTQDFHRYQEIVALSPQTIAQWP